MRKGQKAVLECVPRGDQPIRLSWTRHGEPVISENYFKVNLLFSTKVNEVDNSKFTMLNPL